MLRSAVRNRLIAFNPALDVRVPKRRKTDTDDQIISRPTLRQVLLPQMRERHWALIATAAGCGLRWGEVAGLMDDGLDLDAEVLRVIRTGAASSPPWTTTRGPSTDVRCCLFAASILLRNDEGPGLGSLRSL